MDGGPSDARRSAPPLPSASRAQELAAPRIFRKIQIKVVPHSEGDRDRSERSGLTPAAYARLATALFAGGFNIVSVEELPLASAASPAAARAAARPPARRWLLRHLWPAEADQAASEATRPSPASAPRPPAPRSS